MNKPLFTNRHNEFFYSLFLLSLFIILACDINIGSATTVSGELISSGSGQVTSETITHYGVIGQASPVGMSTVSNGKKIISGNLITGSGIGAYSETDGDNDGTLDKDDVFPEDPKEDTDTDNDRIGNNADPDDDNDGVNDDDDVFPFDPDESADTDRDGTGDNEDAFPDDPDEDTDTDEDGTGDNGDVFPDNPEETVDTDSDGVGNNADTDDDNDGVDDSIEENHPNSGDGNDDGIPDQIQGRVTSLLSANGQDYITLESSSGTVLTDCQALSALPGVEDLPDTYLTFKYGFIAFTIGNLNPDGNATLTLHFPDDADIESYYKHGRTTYNQSPHWYEFLYDEETGAVIDNENKTITLHFKDGQRGDSNTEADGFIIDSGGAGINPSGSSGSCFIDVLF